MRLSSSTPVFLVRPLARAIAASSFRGLLFDRSRCVMIVSVSKKVPKIAADLAHIKKRSHSNIKEPKEY